MIVVIGGVQAAVRIDMTMPKAPDPKEAAAGGISPWEREAYGEGGRFGNMQMMPSGDPSKDRISVYYTGCGFNVARLLAQKGRSVAFVSVVGDDPLGYGAKGELQREGVDVSEMRIIDAFSPAKAGAAQSDSIDGKAQDAASAAGARLASSAVGARGAASAAGARDAASVAGAQLAGSAAGARTDGPDAEGTVANGLIRQSLTSVRVEAKNFLGDTEFLREDARMMEELTVERIRECQPLLEKAELVFADGSVPQETLRWIAARCREAGVRLYLDPASVQGGAEAADLLDGLHGIMPGRREAEAMSGLQILSADQLMEAGAHFAEQGVRQIIITMKGGGIYYKEGKDEGILRPQRVLRFSETVGAGDVVTAALLHAYAEEQPIDQAAQQAMDAAAAYLADCVDERRY